MSLQYLHVVELIFGACFNPVHGVQVPFVPAVPFGQLEHFILPSMNVVIPGEHLSHLDWPATLHSLFPSTFRRGLGHEDFHDCDHGDCCDYCCDDYDDEDCCDDYDDEVL